MGCETHKSFRDRDFKPHESNFRGEVRGVADGYVLSRLMKIMGRDLHAFAVNTDTVELACQLIQGWGCFENRGKGYTRLTLFYRARAMTNIRRTRKKLTAENLIRAIASSTAIETGQSVEAVERKLKVKDSRFLHLALAK